MKEKYETSEAQRRAVANYDKNKVDRVLLRLPKGKKEDISGHISRTGESLNGFVIRAIDETIERDNISD